ncbi:carbon-nitrogen hydrolase family protein [Nocardia higoensis]|uniref:Carbon-nitrogen hydrolase family protein n=1 Tax=Nocardia higoensis TaxID=228599 RepID=A0ABS0DE97_9NOCA|nr:carbon-nitrogen hydrolase family protein [Nocardia higoensis]MBF6355229.1 carbon-nitrogen hydrolase family protein [Nocardia higoensis]
MRLQHQASEQGLRAPAVTLGVVQFTPSTDPQANLTALGEQVRAAAGRGARVVIAPEYAMHAVRRLDRRVVPVAQPLDGQFATGLAELARAAGVFLVAGMIETGGDTRIRNTLVAVDPGGERVAVYRKVHLYDAFGHKESDVVEPGPLTEPVTFLADGVTIGLQTCFDLRFPEGFRRLAAAGAQVIAVPAQWIPGPGKVDQWTTLLRARAIENTVYLAAADQAEPLGSGASMIIDPAGAVLAELGAEPGVLTATAELDHLDAVRTHNPSLALRRFVITEPRPQE